MSYFAKLSRSPRLMTLVACGAILATIPVNPAKAGSGDPSTYQSTCKDISVTGSTLSATCRKEDGSYNKPTEIPIRGIYNENGSLSYLRNKSSSSTYQNSCQSITVSKATLSATCRKRDGTSSRDSIGILGIDNKDGILRHS